jgi:hypothetical protein
MRIAAEKMVLNQPGTAVAEAIGEFDLPERFGVRLRFAQAKPLRDCYLVEEIESHGRPGDRPAP